jgi:hypothetical protein
MVGTILMDVSQRIQNAYVLTDSDDNIEGWVTCRGAHTIRLEIMLAKPLPFLHKFIEKSFFGHNMCSVGNIQSVVR